MSKSRIRVDTYRDLLVKLTEMIPDGSLDDPIRLRGGIVTDGLVIEVDDGDVLTTQLVVGELI